MRLMDYHLAALIITTGAFVWLLTRSEAVREDPKTGATFAALVVVPGAVWRLWQGESDSHSFAFWLDVTALVVIVSATVVRWRRQA